MGLFFICSITCTTWWYLLMHLSTQFCSPALRNSFSKAPWPYDWTHLLKQVSDALPRNIFCCCKRMDSSWTESWRALSVS